MAKGITKIIGLDLSDKTAEACVLPLARGDVERRETLDLTPVAMLEFFSAEPRARVIMEAGTHSPWLSRLLADLGHDVRVADPRRLKMVTENVRKSDYTDPEVLARMGRVDDLELVRPVEHREEQMQADFSIVKARDQLVRARTALVNFARGTVKSMGARLPSCSTDSFATKEEVWSAIPTLLQPALHGLMCAIGYLTSRIKEYDKAIEAVLAKRYPEANQALRQISGVGPITALCFICVIQNPERFETSRAVGPYVGLAPGRKQSGESDPKRGITKTGDALLRCQLTRAANYILTFGEDSDLRRMGARLLAKDKPRLVTSCAVARKLAVVLHRLWVTGEEYRPLNNAPPVREPAPLLN